MQQSIKIIRRTLKTGITNLRQHFESPVQRSKAMIHLDNSNNTQIKGII